MSDELGNDRFSWKPAAYLTGCGLLAAMLIELSPAFDFLELPYFILLVPLAGLALLLFAITSTARKRRRLALSILLALVAYCGTSWLLWKGSTDLRFKGRWLLNSRTYKAEVMALPAPKSGELQHMEWDGWGMTGSETNVYLVFDPNDSLALATKGKAYSNVPGLPCDVWQIHRLESHWYSVVFFTNADWDDC